MTDVCVHCNERIRMTHPFYGIGRLKKSPQSLTLKCDWKFSRHPVGQQRLRNSRPRMWVSGHSGVRNRTQRKELKIRKKPLNTTCRGMLNLEEEKALEGGHLKADEKEIHWKSDLQTGIGCALGWRRGVSLGDCVESRLRWWTKCQPIS